MEPHDRTRDAPLPRGGRCNSLDLMNGTGIGGSSADGPPEERCTVEGADAVAVAGGLQDAGVGAAPSGEVRQRFPDGLVEALQLGVVKAPGGTGGVEAGLEQRLVDEEVAEAGDLRLVHEPGLEGDAALAQHAAQ